MRTALLALVCLVGAAAAQQAPPEGPPRELRASPSLVIQRVDREPTLDDFAAMKPSPEWEGRLTKVPSFVQRDPVDGAPPTLPTDVYVGYDHANLYVIFVAFDPEPGKIRARMTRREAIWDDDIVQVLLDTFHDKRRAYSFLTNGRGIQWDRIWEEPGSTDDSWDTVWKSDGRITEEGYLSLIAIPFKSLRFPRDQSQTWGIVFQRIVPRISEVTFWPPVSARIAGRMNQGATLTGLEGISPGRNMQFIPYTVGRSFRAIDRRDPLAPFFHTRRAEFDGGLDGKLILRDAFVLDFAINPDFSQVESDFPQVTVNQRFEVFFPEKRPFFLENSDFFRTPFNLMFSRRIADPQFGLRLTGKMGPWSVGLLAADDQAPGRIVPPGHPLEGKRAYFGVARVKYDIRRESNLGVIFTDREFAAHASGPGAALRTAFNRVAGVDGSFRLSDTWRTTFQAIVSNTKFADGSRITGPGYEFRINRQSRQLNYQGRYSDRSPDLRVHTGFIPRVDVRVLEQNMGYRWRPEGRRLIAHGPQFYQVVIYDHQGAQIERAFFNDYRVEFKSQTVFGGLLNSMHERIRPQDFGPALASRADFTRYEYGGFFETGLLQWLTIGGILRFNTVVNFVPPAGRPPHLAGGRNGNVSFTLRPVDRLSIDNSYTYSTLTNRENGGNIFNNHILRSRANYQLTRALSLRFITQYNTLLANPANTVLRDNKSLNFDVLATYLLTPGTALYVGYNTNLSNLDPALALDPNTGNLLRTRDPFTNDGRQLFVKASYLFRF